MCVGAGPGFRVAETKGVIQASVLLGEYLGFHTQLGSA